MNNVIISSGKMAVSVSQTVQFIYCFCLRMLLRLRKAEDLHVQRKEKAFVSPAGRKNQSADIPAEVINSPTISRMKLSRHK